MPKRYVHSSAITAEHIGDYLDTRDEDVMRGLVTAGAFVALADGRVEKVERDELVNFIDRQQFVPTISTTEIAEMFDQRVRQLEDRNSAEVIIENLRPLAGLSLGSVVLRTAERVAGADRQIHAGELQALELIRLIMTGLSAKGLPAKSRSCDGLGYESGFDAHRIQEDLVRRSPDPRIRWLYQGAAIRRLVLIWRFDLRKQISVAILIAVIVGLVVGLVMNFWAKSNVLATTGADAIRPEEKFPSASNLHPHPRIESPNDVDGIDPKDELLPMFNPYLPFRILDPVY
jgi:tellurite resistance protein